MKTRNKQRFQDYLAEMAQIRVTCAKCGRKDARLSPMGVLCLTCTFGQEKPEDKNEAPKTRKTQTDYSDVN